MDKAELIRHEIEKRRAHNLAIGNPLFAAMAEEDIELLSFIDSLQEESVSEELEQAIDTYLATYFGGEKEKQEWPFLKKMVIYFTKWQKEQIIKRLCNHANIDQMTEKFEDKYKPENVLDTEYYKRGIFDTIKAIKEG